MKTRILLENCRLVSPPTGHALSILLENGRIKRLSDSPTQSVEGEVTRIDVHDCTVLPGLIDTHCHLVDQGATRRMVDLRAAANMTALRLRLYGVAARAHQGEWILGRGWDQEKMSEARFPARQDIDDVTIDNPTLLTRVCGHVGLLNTSAIRLLGLEGERSSLSLVERDEHGALTGIVREGALALVRGAIRHEGSLIEDDILNAEYEALKNGVTTVHCILSENYLQEMQALSALDGAGRLSLRYRLYLPLAGADLLRKESPGIPRSSERVRLSGVKLFADGSLGARTAALTEPYADDPANSGILNYTGEELDPILLRMASLGVQVAVHAIGDSAISLTLDAFARVSNECRDNRWRIEHASLSPGHIRRKMRDLGLGVAVQPQFVSSDTWAVDRLGRHRLPDLYPYKSLLKAGIQVGGGSDAPVESLSPILGIWSAMVRSGYGDEERLSLQEAISLYAGGAAFLSADDDLLGKIEEGYAADLTVLDASVDGLHPAMIRRVGVAHTIMDGKVAYSYEGVT